MNITSIPADKTVFVIGAPRSGTTWTGKIFDSHPGVLYRHEPDTVERDRSLQRVFEPEDYEANRAHAAAYLDQLVATRGLKASGSMPQFRKNYTGAAGHWARLGLIVGGHALSRLGLAGRLRALRVPDMVDPARAGGITVVIKTISSRGRAGLFAHARPASRFVLILRDPFGQVASVLRGIRMGMFEREVKLTDCLGTAQARRYGIDAALFARLAPIEQHAWHWALMNEKALDDLNGRPNTMVVRYRDLVADPAARSRDMFAFAGLPWHPQTERFLHASTSSVLPDRYYHVYKNSLKSLNKWRTQLTDDEKRRIAASVSGTAVWRMYPELHDTA